MGAAPGSSFSLRPLIDLHFINRRKPLQKSTVIDDLKPKGREALIDCVSQSHVTEFPMVSVRFAIRCNVNQLRPFLRLLIKLQKSIAERVTVFQEIAKGYLF